MNHEAERAAVAQLEAYNARNIEDFCAVYAEDIQLIDLLSGEIFCAGKAQMYARYAEYFAKTPLLHCRLIKRIVCGNVAIDEEEVSGLPDGKILHATAIYEVRNALISRAWFVREKAE